jgi:hypothetical protein
MEHREVILSTIAGLATIFVGYVVWKHEQVISAANAQAQQDAQDAANEAQQQALMNEITALPTGSSFAGGNGASQQSYYGTNVPDTGSTALESPASASNDLQAILAAFYPSQVVTPASSTNNATPSNNSAPSTPTSLAQFITTQLQTGTANQTYNLSLPTTATNYVAPIAASIYH